MRFGLFIWTKLGSTRVAPRQHVLPSSHGMDRRATQWNLPPGFAGHTDWRLPAISELQSITIGPGVTDTVIDDPLAGTNPTIQATTCASTPCLDPNFLVVAGPAAGLPGYEGGDTEPWYQWSATHGSGASASNAVWTVNFSTGTLIPLTGPNPPQPLLYLT